MSFSYLKLQFVGFSKPHPYVLGSGILCIFIVISVGIFLGFGEANKIPGSLISSTWVCFPIFTTKYLNAVLIFLDHSYYLKCIHTSNTLP